MTEGVMFNTEIKDTLDQRLDLIFKQFNISMTNTFQFWGNQVVSVNLLLLDQQDLIAKSPIQSTGYYSNDAISESYGIRLKSVYNNYWESNLYFN